MTTSNVSTQAYSSTVAELSMEHSMQQNLIQQVDALSALGQTASDSSTTASMLDFFTRQSTDAAAQSQSADSSASKDKTDSSKEKSSQSDGSGILTTLIDNFAVQVDHWLAANGALPSGTAANTESAASSVLPSTSPADAAAHSSTDASGTDASSKVNLFV